MPHSQGVNQTESLKRLKRIQGQLQGIERMIASQRYCIDILQQITAARRALEQVGLQIMQRHVQGCVAEAVKHKRGDEKIRELITTVEQFVR